MLLISIRTFYKMNSVLPQIINFRLDAPRNPISLLPLGVLPSEEFVSYWHKQDCKCKSTRLYFRVTSLTLKMLINGYKLDAPHPSPTSHSCLLLWAHINHHLLERLLCRVT